MSAHEDLLIECDLCFLKTHLLKIPSNKKGELYCPACEELFQ